MCVKHYHTGTIHVPIVMGIFLPKLVVTEAHKDDIYAHPPRPSQLQLEGQHLKAHLANHPHDTLFPLSRKHVIGVASPDFP